MKKTSVGKRCLTTALTLILAMSVIFAFPISASAEVLPENAADVGVYTNGASHVKDIGSPTYTYVSGVEAALAPGVPWTADSMYGSIFEKDKAAGGTDYYLDRVLGVSGNLGNAVLMTRGRSLYMRAASNSNFNTMGFDGAPFAGGRAGLGNNLYTITLSGQSVSEVAADRFNAPSHAKVSFNVGNTGVRADTKKFITFDNVAVTTVKFTNSGSENRTFTVQAQSATATIPVEGADNELRGQVTLHSGSVNNNGLNNTPWGQVTVGLKAKDFTVNGSRLERSITIPAGESVEFSVVGSVYSADLPDSLSSFRAYTEMAPAEAFKTGVTAFNERWAADIPYIDVPSPAIEKAIVYRWWGERYNSLDTNESGYAYQFPVTIEGVNLYQNAIVLTQPMHLQDTKWHRTPYLPYGQIFNLGELSGSSAFLDSPGAGNWNNHYSQYMGTAGLEAYNVHGGGADIANKFAYYFENDGIGQLEHYDGNGNNLIAYTANYMPGNDADALTFGYPRTGGTTGNGNIERPESAYVWGDFDAARQLYKMGGASQAKVDALAEKANTLKQTILSQLWSPEMKMFLAKTTRGAQAAASRNGNNNPLADRNFIPVRESNLYDVYAQNLIDPADYATYVDGFRFLTYGDNHPIFPFYTANQYDKTRYNIGGSNNFSNINFTVQYRGVRSGLRYYDPQRKYLDEAYAAQLLDWMAWSIYPNGGDLRQPNQAEYYSGWNASTKNYSRTNPNHVMLGNMNYIYIEDMGGILPRSDDVIELWPIDLGYDHFMVNNLRYHGKDVTIVWDKDGTEYGLGTGYSLFIDGEKKVTVDKLGKFTYNPNTNEVEASAGLTVAFKAIDGSAFPTAVATPIEDERVVDYLKKAGIDQEVNKPNLAREATATASFTQQGARPASWRNFHTPGISGQMNYDPGSISATERPAAVAAVNDGMTVNEPYWGNYGTANSKDWVELDFGKDVTFDNLQIYFYNDSMAGGYVPPQSFVVQVPDGAGWKAVPDQSRASKNILAKRNDVTFGDVTASKVRVLVTNKPESYTAITEIQVFDSDKPLYPPIPNDAPTVSLSVNSAKAGNISTELVAAVDDDGLPLDGLYSYGWSLVSAPQDATARIVAPGGFRTMVLGSAPGEYTFKFTASDGDKTTEKTIAVTLATKDMSAEFGATATISSTGCASWENQNNVNAASTPASSTATGCWGTWGQTRNGTSQATMATLTYTWAEPISATRTEIYWYDDNGGTRRPQAATWRVEFSVDGQTWKEPVFKSPTAYADSLVLNRYNALEFAEAIDAKYMRISIWGVQGSGAGTGIERWRVYGDAVESVEEPIFMRVATDNLPQLPAKLYATYASGKQGELSFVWDEVTPEMVAAPNVESFSVFGYNAAYNLYAEAQIYVRPENSEGGISITGVSDYEVSFTLGEKPVLPAKVEVSYNDGSRDNQAHGVTWDLDPDLLLTPGTYEIRGTIDIPWYVGPTDAKPTLTLIVNAGDSFMLSMLGMFIAEYNDLDTSPYTKESVDAFQEAMDEALAIMYDGAACTDEQILAAIEKLMDAAEALVFKPDKSLLALAIEAAETQDLTGVVPKAKENLQAKLTAAKDVYDDEDATVEAIDTAYNALIEAMADLQKGGNKAALQVLLTLAGKMVKANYTPASWADFEDSIEAANVVVADENALQPHVDKASSDLTESMKKLVRVANFAALSSAVSIAQNIVDNIDDYVASTVVGLASELDKAKLLLENTNATQAEVNAQATALNTKILTARIKPDRSPLLNALNQAKAVNLNLYTEESGKGLSALMVKAQSILDKSDKDLRQSEVNSMARDLKDAITGLVAKSAKDSGKTKAAAAETKNKAAGKTAGSKSPAPSAAKNSGTASGGNTAAAAGTTTRGANPSATAGTQTAGLNAAAGDAVTAADEGAAAGVQDSMTPAQTTEKTEKNPSESIPYGLYGLGIILLLCLAGFLIRWNQKRQKE